MEELNKKESVNPKSTHKSWPPSSTALGEA